MILPRIASLNQVSNQFRFQRRLESLLPLNNACHSSEGWNLSPFSMQRLFTKVNLQLVLQRSHTAKEQVSGKPPLFD